MSSAMRRRGRSVEVVDAKFAVDLATAQTYSENVFLFVPNLIGSSLPFPPFAPLFSDNVSEQAILGSF